MFDLIKRESALFQIARKIIKYYLYQLHFNSLKVFRKNLGFSSRFNGIKKYHNLHKGERCFIIATGPSLTISDLKKLENEYTFGMNSLCKVFSDMGYETTYFGIQDRNVYESMKNSLDRINDSICFIGSTININKKQKPNFISFPLNILDHSYNLNSLGTKFSPNAFATVYDGYSITYSLIQIAVYMGFEDIYLIGADTNYSDDKDKQHFVETGHFDPTYKTAGKRMIEAYKVAKDYADKNNINIYNATRGGMLEVFQRVDLDAVLGLKGNNDVS